MAWALDIRLQVCSSPLEVLKAAVVQFDPPLPSAHQKAMARLGTGALAAVPQNVLARHPHICAC
jgi:hypothetical protein